MGPSYVTAPLVFLIDTVFSLYILAVVLRFLLQWNRADFYNPISQFLVRITHPPLKLLRRIVPAVGKIDTSSLILALGLQMLANLAILLISGAIPNFAGLILISFADVLKIVLDIFVYAIFVNALLSWIAPNNYNAASSLLYTLTEPVLRICRRMIPDIGGIDLSPLIALVLLQLTKMMVLPPLHELAKLLS
jgi:YggT family protein